MLNRIPESINNTIKEIRGMGVRGMVICACRREYDNIFSPGGGTNGRDRPATDTLARHLGRYISVETEVVVIAV